MFGLGHWELLIVAFVILLLFGNRLPGMMRSLGRGVVEFKHGLHGVDEDESKAGKKDKIEGES
ncbi:MAG: twin-arginine translocase TatA/TatE family subunit [Planctomycetes bacterium]|nr:twin-arginine translocase TatA/TatE family subunit [Planctomycetota bacterium]